MVGAQNPEEWLAQTDGASQEASLEEMRQYVDADTCAVNWEGKVDCREESNELPWSMTEHLFASGTAGEKDGESLGLFRMLLALLCVFAAVCVLSTVDIKRSGSHQHRLMSGSLLLATAAYCANLLDGMVFGIALVSSVAAMMAKLVLEHLGIGKCGVLPTRQVKTV